MPPIHRLAGSGKARATKPPAKPPSSVAARPTPLMIAAYSLREKPRSITNGAGHGAGQRVGELEQHDEGQHDERANRRREKSENAPTAASTTRASGFCRAWVASRRPTFRLGRDERGRDADQHQRRHGDIARAPGGVLVEAEALKAADQKQRAGGRDQHADAIGGDIGRHAGGLLAFVQAFDPEGIDDDVLRRRSGRDQQRAERDQPRRDRRIAAPRKTIAAISRSCDSNSQPRRRPSRRDSSGTSSASISGAHRNLMV